MTYLNIEDDGHHGINSDAILNNLGYCMASTTGEDFYYNVYKTGLDLSRVILNNYTIKEFNEIFNFALEKLKEIGGGCVANDYSINSYYIGCLAEMISCLNLYRKRKLNIFNKISARKNIINFYINYFLILRGSRNYDFTLETSFERIGFFSNKDLNNNIQGK